MNSVLEWLYSESGRILIASAIGSAIAVLLDWTGSHFDKIKKFFVGTIIGAYTYELALPITKFFIGSFVDKEPSIALSGFLMGYLGIVFVETLKIGIKKLRDKF